MKKLLLTALLLTSLVSLHAASQFGAALDTSISVDGRTVGTSNGTQFDMYIVPTFIIKLDSTVQLEPFIGLRYHSEYNPDLNPGIPWGNNVKTFGVVPGASLYWFPVKADRWTFGTGIKLWFEFGPFANEIQVPFIIEFAITDNIHLRISQKVAGMRFTSTNNGASGAAYTEQNTFVFTTFAQGFNPYFGFSFYF